MCGIAGFLGSHYSKDDAGNIVAEMASRLAHRGPDSQGVWTDEFIALGHRRLSIIDLSPAGKQPMVSWTDRYVIVFNGEIYNHKALRWDLEKTGVPFIGRSDTETLLALIERDGVDRALRRCRGMFAIALWDRQERILTLARDRAGEKPLYFGWHGHCFLFGSELKAFSAHPEFRPELSEEAISLFLRYGYIPAPYSIYKNTWKLRQAEILCLPVLTDGRFPGPDRAGAESRQFWSPEAAAVKGIEQPYKGTFDDAVIELESLLSDAVALQMEADVPLGAFLSGGLDSSTVVAMMQRRASNAVKTFSIGFELERYDESSHARAVAQYLGTAHSELRVSSSDALSIIPALPKIFDEPFADPSQIPTLVVSRLARSEVTVSLSGDGGDEVFGGYPKYILGNRLARAPFKPLALRGIQMAKGISSLLERSDRFSTSPSLRPLRRLQYLPAYLSCKNPVELAGTLSAINKDPRLNPAYNVLQSTGFRNDYPLRLEQDYHRLAMTIDMCTYLADDILVKVDRASMAVSLESRAPLLDHCVVEFARSLPHSWLIDGSESKRILRRLLFSLVPRNLVDRPKSGFSIPLAEWLRGPLYDWAWDLLQSACKRGRKGFEHSLWSEVWKSHQSKARDNSVAIWSAVIFEAWEREAS